MLNSKSKRKTLKKKIYIKMNALELDFIIILCLILISSVIISAIVEDEIKFKKATYKVGVLMILISFNILLTYVLFITII